MDEDSKRGDGGDARGPEAPVDERSETVFEGAPFEPSARPVATAGTAARYRLGPAIGEGGMAVVYEAQDTSLNRLVAVKTLRTEHAGDESHRSRFAAEVRVMAALDHPGAVPVYDAGVLLGGEHFYALKRVRGRTLRDLLTARTPGDVASRHSLAHFTDIFERVCQTVAAAQAAGVIHRAGEVDGRRRLGRGGCSEGEVNSRFRARVIIVY